MVVVACIQHTVKPTAVATRAVLLLLLAFVSACLPGEAAPADRKMLVSVADLRTHGIPVPFGPILDCSSFTKNTFFDGTVDFDYSCDPGEAIAFYMNVTATFNRRRSDARLDSMISSGVGSLTAYGSETRKVRRDELFKYGDKSKLIEFQDATGAPLGNQFFTRVGAKTYAMLITGVAIRSPRVWQAVMVPRLKHWEQARLRLFSVKHPQSP